MKKIATLFICIFLVFGLAACGNTSGGSFDDGDVSVSSDESADNGKDSFTSANSSEIENADVSPDGTLPDYTPVDLESIPENAEEDFVFTVEDGVAKISAYTGTATQVRIPSSLGGSESVFVLHDAFNGNEDITFVYIPGSAESNAFANCTSLEEVRIGAIDLYNELPSYMFSACTSLRRVEIGEGWYLIPESAFEECTSLTEVILPSSIQVISRNAFSCCRNLESIDLSNTDVYGLGDMAFGECDCLSSVALPSTLYGDSNYFVDPFYMCPSLSEITFPNGNDELELVDGILYTTYGELLYKLMGYVNSDIVVRDGTYAICNNAFQYDTGITSVIIPDSVNTIERNAFSGCTNLKQVDFGNGVTAICQYSFEDCVSLTELKLPDTELDLVDGAFEGCTSLASVYLPDGVSLSGDATIDNDVFSGCEKAVFTYKGQTYTYEEAEALTRAINVD